MNNIAIFASGTGSNAKQIIDSFVDSAKSNVRILLTNNKNAGAISKAEGAGVAVKIFNRNDFYNTDEILNTLKNNNIDLIVLAGFLWLVPKNIINEFSGKIINIHPALLPAYGGKGMYGDNVHKAVIEAGEKESGITIHYVTEEYDQGDIIFQAKCDINPSDTAETLAQKIHSLEHKYFPEVLKKITGE